VYLAAVYNPPLTGWGLGTALGVMGALLIVFAIGMAHTYLANRRKQMPTRSRR